jgi:hypothetical protein
MSFPKTLIVGLVCSLLAASANGRAQSTAAAAGEPGAANAAATVATGGTKVHGTVTDPDGELIPGAAVTFTPSRGPGRSVKSGSDGTYTLTVAPGTYTMLVSMPGFASFLMRNLKVPALPSTTLDAKLKIGEETTVVNVEASAVELSVDPDSNASSTVLQGKDLESLSDDPDELSSELSALAGPSAGPNGGQIYVDGFTGGQLPPKSSIREIRINQNPFSAQYDRLGFGRVEVFTKPGTDKLHGSFQLNGNPSQFNTANPLFAPSVYQPPYHTLFMFGSVTGPLSKSASYSVGGSHRDIEDNAFTNISILARPSSPGVLCDPGEAGCTTNTAQFVTNTPQVRTDISPRLDLQLGDKNVLTVRYQYVQNDQINGSVGNLALPTYGLNVATRTNEVQLSDTQTWSSRLINETRFEYERERVADTALGNGPSVSVSGAFSSGNNPTQNTSDHQDHFEVQNYTSLQLAKNFIRFGGRLRTTREAQNPAQNTNGTFVYSSLANYAAGTVSQFSLTTVNVPALRYTFADLGLYAESDWKVRPNLTVSYGIRWETQNHLPDHHDFAPRVSFAYGVGRGKSAPKTVIRGGFGIFYDRFNGTYILNLLRQNGTNTTTYTLGNVLSACTPLNSTFKTACIAGVSPSLQTVYTRTDNLRTPYITEFAGGFDQQLTRAGSLSVNYLHSQGVHQLATQNIGYPQVLPVGVIPGQNLRVPAHYQYFSEGVFRQDQLIVNGRVSTGRRISLFGYYSLNFAKGDTSGAGSNISTPYNIAADYGRTSFDVRNRLFLAGSISLPKFIQISPFMVAQSGSPYNVTVGQDVNGDTFFNDRPYRVSGVIPNGNTVKAINGCGTFAAPGSAPAGSSIAPINACTGPGLFTFNFRLTKTWGFGEQRSQQNNNAGAGSGGPGGPGGGRGGRGGGGRGGPSGMFGGGGASTGRRYNVALGLQVQNLFGNRDLATPNGTLLSPIFGQQTQLSGGPYTTNAATRRIALQASFNF